MANVVIQRKASISVFVAGVQIGHVKSVQWSGGFNQPYNEGKAIVTQLPSGFDNDQTFQIIAGNGSSSNTRFVGLTRSPIYNLDGTITIQGVSTLALAYQYQNSEDPRSLGGLEIFDIFGTNSCTDQAMVQAILNKAHVSFSPANVGGTGVVWGAQTIGGITTADAFMWLSADSPTTPAVTPRVGESALDYIMKWDQVSAIHPGPFQPAGTLTGNSPGAVTSPVGFYRTFQTLNGTVYRSLIGGRPRGTPTIATPFTEGVDIRIGQITRGYPLGNRFAAIGYDTGSGFGPERFTMQSSNPYMPGTRPITIPPITSPFIEKSAENDGGPGMSCERVTYAMEPDVNRIIVSGSITTGRDDYISQGATILVQGPGGLPSRLGTGENVWVQAIRGSASMSGFIQEIEILGGGVPDNYLPSVPQT